MRFVHLTLLVMVLLLGLDILPQMIRRAASTLVVETHITICHRILLSIVGIESHD